MEGNVVRNLQSTSINSLLHLFQTEWDSIMLETYTLKQQLETTRKELSKALYQHDAACRVIARLLKEKETLEQSAQAARTEPQGIPPQFTQQIDSHSAKLMEARKGRRPSPDLAPPTYIKQFQEPTSVQLLHGSAGVTCLAIQDRNLEEGQQSLTLTGGQDGLCVLFDRTNAEIISQLRGHSKRVYDVAFHPTLDILLSCSEDKTARLWASNENGQYASHYTFKTHNDSVTGVDIHPTGDYFAASSLDGHWSFYDIAKGVTYFNLAAGEPLSTLRIHPDGVIAATATVSGKVQLWNLKTQKCVSTIQHHQDKINSLSFSENGYELATGSSDKSAKVIDLRKMEASKVLGFDKEVNVVSFDYSGSYFGVGFGSVVQIYQSKLWGLLNTFAHHQNVVTGVKFGSNAQSIVTTSLDRQVYFYQL